MGRRIAFDRWDNIYLINPDGTEEVPLTSNNDTSPSFSPDGKKISFCSLQDDTNGDIWVMDADGTNQVKLISNQSSGGYNLPDTEPAWSAGYVPEPFGTLTGRVVDAGTNLPIEGATVTVYTRNPVAVLTATTTNANGSYTLAVSLATETIFDVFTDIFEYQGQRVEAAIAYKETTVCNFALPKADFDLWIKKSGPGTLTLPAEGTITYTINWGNDSLNKPVGTITTITDTLPVGVDYTTATPAPDEIIAGTQTMVIWRIATVSASFSATYTLTGRLNFEVVQSGTNLQNKVEITAPGVDFKPGDNVGWHNTYLSGAGTFISGDITEDTVWAEANSPYIITNNITVKGTSIGKENAVTLTIESGVVVKFNQGTTLRVGEYVDGQENYYGNLKANGTQDKTITFTPNKLVGTPVTGSWQGLIFSANSVGTNPLWIIPL